MIKKVRQLQQVTHAIAVAPTTRREKLLYTTLTTFYFVQDALVLNKASVDRGTTINTY